MKQLLSLAEIAALQLPNFPTTKVALGAMAKREGWYSEERKGLGGTRRVYALPEHYLEDGDVAPKSNQEKVHQVSKPERTNVVGAIAAGTSKVNPAKLELAIRALSEWETERNVKVDPARRPAVIAILYDYLQNSVEEESKEAMSMVLRALG